MHLVTVSAAMTSPRLYENGITGFLEAGRRDSTLVMPPMPCSPAAAMVATEKGPAAVPMGKVEAAVKEEVDGGDGKDSAVKAPTRTVVTRPRLPAVMAASTKPPIVVPPRWDATGVARRDIGGSTARRSYAPDAMDGGTLLMSALRQKRKLYWRRRVTMLMIIRSRVQLSRPERQASAVMFRAKRGKRSCRGK